MTTRKAIYIVKQLAKLHNPKITDQRRQACIEALERIHYSHKVQIADMEARAKSAEREAEYLRGLLLKAREVIELRAGTMQELDHKRSQRQIICRRIENVVGAA